MVLKLKKCSVLAIAIALIVLLNPDLRQITILYRGCILFCLGVFIWQIRTHFSLGFYMTWRVTMIIWCFLSYVLLSAKNNTGYAYMMDFILQSLITFVCCMCIRNGLLKQMLQDFVLAALVTCLYACIKSGPATFLVKTLGYFTLGTQLWNSNYLGCLAAYAFLCILVIKKINSDTLLSNKIVTAVLVTIFWITIIWSGSRTALLVGVIGFCIFSVISAKNSEVTLRRILTIIAFVVFLYFLIMKVPVLYDVIGNRMERLFDFVGQGVVEEKSIDWRNQMIAYGFTLFAENPIFGVGIDSFRIYFYQKAAFMTYAHNNFIELLADGGIVGFILYYSIFIKGLVEYRKSKISYKKYLLLLLAALLLSDISSISYQSLDAQFLLCVVVSALCVRMDERKILISN